MSDLTCDERELLDLHRAVRAKGQKDPLALVKLARHLADSEPVGSEQRAPVVQSEEDKARCAALEAGWPQRINALIAEVDSLIDETCSSLWPTARATWTQRQLELARADLQRALLDAAAVHSEHRAALKVLEEEAPGMYAAIGSLALALLGPWGDCNFDVEPGGLLEHSQDDDELGVVQ